MILNKPVYQDFRFKIITALGYLVGFLFLFGVVRLAIWLAYHPVFDLLSNRDIWVGFLYGILFDLSIICLFMSPVLLLWCLPVQSKRYLKIVQVAWLLLGVFFVFVLVADFVYFPEAKRHMAEELLYIKNEIPFVVRYVLHGFWWALLLLGLAFAGALWGSYQMINHWYKPTRTPLWKTLAFILCVAVFMFIAIRGKIGRGKPLSMRSLNSLASGTAQGVLMSNGLFSAYHALRNANLNAENPMCKTEALAKAREILSSSQEKFIDPQYPLVRVAQGAKALNKKNIFVVLLESWTPRYIDAYGGGNYGVTPHFDEVARRGIQFNNAYAVGVRSIFGLTATFAGIPLVPGLVQFSDGLELNNITSLAQILRDKGYYTAFMQSSLRSSYQMCNMATHIFGFEESYGMEDFPALLPYKAEQDFGYDYDLLQFAAGKAAAAKQAKRPFLIFTFTGTTHTPFNPTTDQFEKYPRTREENKYLNTLYYADFSIGKLLEAAQKDGWLNDTVFVFMADHTFGHVQKGNDIYKKFRIPYVIYAPGLLAARQVEYPVSQLDLIPTLFHLLGLQEPFAALGADSLNPTIVHQAFIVEGNQIALITPQGYIRHNREKGLESSADKQSALYRDMEQNILALDKSVTSLLQSNRWMKSRE